MGTHCHLTWALSTVRDLTGIEEQREGVKNKGIQRDNLFVFGTPFEI